MNMLTSPSPPSGQPPYQVCDTTRIVNTGARNLTTQDGSARPQKTLASSLQTVHATAFCLGPRFSRSTTNQSRSTAPIRTLTRRYTSTYSYTARCVLFRSSPRHSDDLTYCLVQGSTYPFPFRPISGQSTLKEIRDSLRGFQHGIKNASSILIVGGGPTGAEFAGEIAAQHQGKKITVGLHDARLLSQLVPALSYHAIACAQRQLSPGWGLLEGESGKESRQSAS